MMQASIPSIPTGSGSPSPEDQAFARLLSERLGEEVSLDTARDYLADWAGLFAALERIDARLARAGRPQRLSAPRRPVSVRGERLRRPSAEAANHIAPAS